MVFAGWDNLESEEGKDHRVRTTTAGYWLQIAVGEAYQLARDQFRWEVDHCAEDMQAVEREHDAAGGVSLGRGTRDLLRTVVQLAAALAERDSYAFLRRVRLDDRDAAEDELTAAQRAAEDIGEWSSDAGNS